MKPMLKSDSFYKISQNTAPAKQKLEIRPPDMENCWKRVGVWGTEKPVCPLLGQVIHCRNCDVFTQAGRELFERELSDEYKDERTGLMAAKKEESLPGTVSVIIFRIEEEWLAIRTQSLAEVIDPETLHSHTLPHRKNPVLIGLINVHGEIQLCVSLRELLGIEEETKKDDSGTPKETRRMMVMNSETGQWVFPVNEMLGIHRVHPSAFRNVPVTVAKAQSTYTKSIFKWEDRHVAFLDDDLLLYSLVKKMQ
ncbi:MAG: hypothetical protein B6245_01215 [Desulfobacteraceae bacterium 4572_88]|nr:MAG: hypothetical protein B6245_01215 [Desulfobacteraceae bacterium 4572_88]